MEQVQGQQRLNLARGEIICERCGRREMLSSQPGKQQHHDTKSPPQQPANLTESMLFALQSLSLFRLSLCGAIIIMADSTGAPQSQPDAANDCSQATVCEDVFSFVRMVIFIPEIPQTAFQTPLFVVVLFLGFATVFTFSESTFRVRVANSQLSTLTVPAPLPSFLPTSKLTLRQIPSFGAELLGALTTLDVAASTIIVKRAVNDWASSPVLQASKPRLSLSRAHGTSWNAISTAGSSLKPANLNWPKHFPFRSRRRSFPTAQAKPNTL